MTVAPEILQRLQQHFHDVIRERAGELVDEAGIALPQLEELLDRPGHEGWFPVPGMYGGFHYVLKEADADLKLICASWCRVEDGSGMRHEITVDGARLVDQGFV